LFTRWGNAPVRVPFTHSDNCRKLNLNLQNVSAIHGMCALIRADLCPGTDALQRAHLSPADGSRAAQTVGSLRRNAENTDATDKVPSAVNKISSFNCKKFLFRPAKGSKNPPSAAAVRVGRGRNGGVSSIYNVKSLRHGLEKAGTFSACLPSGKRSAPSGHAGGRRLFTSQQGNRRGSRRTAAVRRIRSVRIPPSGGN